MAAALLVCKGRGRPMSTQARGCGAGDNRERLDRGEAAPGEVGAAESRDSRSSCWDWCAGSGGDDRRGGIRFGFLLILLGLLWLGGAVGRLPEEAIGPLTVLIIGLWLAVLSRIRWKGKGRKA